MERNPESCSFKINFIMPYTMQNPITPVHFIFHLNANVGFNNDPKEASACLLLAGLYSE